MSIKSMTKTRIRKIHMMMSTTVTISPANTNPKNSLHFSTATKTSPPLKKSNRSPTQRSAQRKNHNPKPKPKPKTKTRTGRPKNSSKTS